MYIANRPLSAGYKIFTALIAWASLWFLVRDYQGSSVQFFATFVALLSGVYFLAAAFKVLFGHRHHPWRAFCPVWHGALLLSALLVLTTQVVASAFPAAAILTPTGVGGLIASLVLPLLIIFDWALFSAKGHWRLIDPWYWLCLPLIYLAINYLIIGATVSSEPLVYPYGFLDYLALGVIPTLIWIGGIMVGCLVLGFLLAGSDRAFRSRETTNSVKSTTKAAISVPTEVPTAATTPVSTATPTEATTSVPPESAAEVTDQPASPSDQPAPDQPTDSDHVTPEHQSETAAPAAQSKSARTSTRKLVDVRPSTKSRRQPTGRKATKTAASKTATATTKTAKSAASKTTKSTTKPTSSKSPKSSKSASTRPTADTTTDTNSTRSLHGRTPVGD